MVIFNTPLEQKLVEVGFDKFSLPDKNMLISILANREELMYSQITDEYILNHHKQLKIDILSEKCEEAIITGFKSSNGHWYRTNRDDQINMIGQKDLLMADETVTIVPWKTEDTGYINHTREEWLQVYIEAFKHKKTQLLKYNTLKQQVLNATTHNEIVAIKWEDEIQEQS
jgi:hypothetical protein